MLITLERVIPFPKCSASFSDGVLSLAFSSGFSVAAVSSVSCFSLVSSLAVSSSVVSLAVDLSRSSPHTRLTPSLPIRIEELWREPRQRYRATQNEITIYFCFCIIFVYTSIKLMCCLNLRPQPNDFCPRTKNLLWRSKWCSCKAYHKESLVAQWKWSYSNGDFVHGIQIYQW